VVPGRKPSEDRLPKGYWDDIGKRVAFFHDFASARGFDPTIPANWEGIMKKQIIKEKVC